MGGLLLRGGGGGGKRYVGPLLKILGGPDPPPPPASSYAYDRFHMALGPYSLGVHLPCLLFLQLSTSDRHLCNIFTLLPNQSIYWSTTYTGVNVRYDTYLLFESLLFISFHCV